LTVDPGTAARDGLKKLLGTGWCEYEFDSRPRNGGSSPQPPAQQSPGDSAELVN
jgi:hypothetical protein